MPGWRDVTREQWESAQWQRVNCVKNIKQLRALMGDLLDEPFYADLEADQQRVRDHVDAGAAADDEHDGARTAGRTTEAFYADPIRRYMIPVAVRPAHRLAVATRTRPATRCTSTTCGWPRA